ncbi:hypothetical protein F4780DRAFT_595293 [Xylariomycetidae sp. FL0641]|nr:hypothetical protein F4780DRAFT_595293 [Xylariomycetidae sp. FL0641]
MENVPPKQSSTTRGLSPVSPTSPETTNSAAIRKRSGSGGSILSKFPFLRTSESKSSLNDASRHHVADNAISPTSPSSYDAAPGKPQSALAAALSQQQQKTRRRKGSLRKVALLGRGAARERREMRPLPTLDTATTDAGQPQLLLPDLPAQNIRHSSIETESPVALLSPPAQDADDTPHAPFGLGISDVTPRPSVDSYAPRRGASPPDHLPPTASLANEDEGPEDDGLARPVSVFSSGSESSLFLGDPRKPTAPPVSLHQRRRRSVKHAKSPLSLSGLMPSAGASGSDAHHHQHKHHHHHQHFEAVAAAAASVGVGGVGAIGAHDYGETEWWGWVVLAVTWFVFVIGMGSCLNVWSWAWDVGTTPYAPPELEDDPTLPITGYYPALLILTCIMAWVWVVVAWVGMKYFRHAKISGD